MLLLRRVFLAFLALIYYEQTQRTYRELECLCSRLEQNIEDINTWITYEE